MAGVAAGNVVFDDAGGKGNPQQVRLIEEEEELVEGEAFVGSLGDTKALVWEAQVWVKVPGDLRPGVWLSWRD